MENEQNDVLEGFFIELEGEIDLANAPQLQQRIETAVEQGNNRVVIDLSKVTFVDSMALGVLVRGKTLCEQKGGRLFLIVSSERLLKILKITGLAETFSHYPTRADLTVALNKD